MRQAHIYACGGLFPVRELCQPSGMAQKPRKPRKKGKPNRIRFFREKGGLTQEQLAGRIERSQTTVKRYETADIDTPASIMLQIAKVLNCTVDELQMERPRTIIDEIAEESADLPPDDQKQVLRLIRGLRRL